MEVADKVLDILTGRIACDVFRCWIESVSEGCLKAELRGELGDPPRYCCPLTAAAYLRGFGLYPHSEYRRAAACLGIAPDDADRIACSADLVPPGWRDYVDFWVREEWAGQEHLWDGALRTRMMETLGLVPDDPEPPPDRLQPIATS